MDNTTSRLKGLTAKDVASNSISTTRNSISHKFEHDETLSLDIKAHRSPVTGDL